MCGYGCGHGQSHDLGYLFVRQNPRLPWPPAFYSSPSSTLTTLHSKVPMYTVPCHCPSLDSVSRSTMYEMSLSAWGVMQVTPRGSKRSRGSRATEPTNSERSTALSRLAGSCESRLPAWRASLFRDPTDASAEHDAPRDALLCAKHRIALRVWWLDSFPCCLLRSLRSAPEKHVQGLLRHDAG